MRKGLVQLLLISLCSAWLMGCGSAKEEDQITLKVWESLEVQGYMEAAAQAYHETHPEINVVIENVEFDNSATRIVLDGPAGAGADLFAAPCDRMGELVSGGYVVPVSNAAKVEERVLPSCRKAATYDGTMYGYPVSDEMQELRYQYLKCIPSVEIQMEDEIIAGFMEQLEYAVPMPSIPQMNSFWETMGSASKNIWDGADVQSTMDSCDKAIVNSTAE